MFHGGKGKKNKLKEQINKKKKSLTPDPSTASPPTPLRVERGVKPTQDHRQGNKSHPRKPPQAPPKEGMSLLDIV